MEKKFLPLMIMLCTLAIISFACNLGGPVADTTPYPTLDPTSLAVSLETSIAINPELQTVVITLDEQQVTTYLSQKIAEQPDAPFENPQVLLQAGKMEVYATAGVSLVTANVRLVIIIAIDSQGNPVINLESANFGPIPIPDTLSDYLAGMLYGAIKDGFGSNPDQLRLLDVQISEGLMIVTLQKSS